MNIKRLMALMLVSSLGAALLSCSQADVAQDTQEDTTAEDTTEADTETETTAAEEGNKAPAKEEAYVIDGVVVYDPSEDYTTMTPSDGLDEHGCFANVTASDHVQLPEYMGVEIDDEILVVTDDEINEQIVMLSEEFPDLTTEIEARPIEEGDTVKIDYEGTVNGIQFEGSSALDQLFTIGTSNLFNNLLTELVGHLPGEVLEIALTLPENLENSELAGAEAVFKVTLDSIMESNIPAIAKELGFETVEALKDDITDFVYSSEIFTNFTDIIAYATCEVVPVSVLKYFIELDISQCQVYAAMSGMTTAEFMSTYYGYETVAEFIDANLEEYKHNAVLYLAAQAIAENEGIVVTTEDIIEAGYGDYIEEYGEAYLKQFMLYQEILPAYIAENAK